MAEGEMDHMGRRNVGYWECPFGVLHPVWRGNDGEHYSECLHIWPGTGPDRDELGDQINYDGVPPRQGQNVGPIPVKQVKQFSD